MGCGVLAWGAGCRGEARGPGTPSCPFPLPGSGLLCPRPWRCLLCVPGWDPVSARAGPTTGTGLVRTPNGTHRAGSVPRREGLWAPAADVSSFSHFCALGEDTRRLCPGDCGNLCCGENTQVPADAAGTATLAPGPWGGRAPPVLTGHRNVCSRAQLPRTKKEIIRKANFECHGLLCLFLSLLERSLQRKHSLQADKISTPLRPAHPR